MRQNLIFAGIATLLLAVLWAFATFWQTPRPPHVRPAGTTSPDGKRVEKSWDEWRAVLTREQYRVTREGGTEWPHSSPLTHEHRTGCYVCVGCKGVLFTSKEKFDSGTGWPSFWAPALPNAVYTEPDGARTEVRCAVCDAHLGHVFNDGPDPTGQRYCINGVALQFVED